MAQPYTVEDVKRMIASSNISDSKKAAQMKVSEPQPYTVEDVERMIAGSKQTNTQQKPITGELWQRAPKSSTEIPYVKEQNDMSVQKSSNESVSIPSLRLGINNVASSLTSGKLGNHQDDWYAANEIVPTLDEALLSPIRKTTDRVIAARNATNSGEIPVLSSFEGLNRLKGYADIDTMLADDYKMSKEEKKYAKQLYKDYMAYFSKQLRDKTISQAEASKIMLDGESDYQKLTRLNNKADSTASFTLGLFSSMPFSDSLMKKGDEMLEEQFGEQYGMSDAIKDAEMQNVIATGAGKFVGNTALYQAAGGVMEQIPGVSALKSKVAGGVADLLGGGAKAAAIDPVAAATRAGFANAVGNSTANILSDLSLDVGLDTIPHVASDIGDGKGAGEVAKNALGNVSMNLLYNVGGEAVSNIPFGKIAGKAKEALNGADDALPQLKAMDDVAEQAVESAKALNENISLIKSLEQPSEIPSSSQINNILKDNDLKHEFEEMSGLTLSGTKAQQRKTIKDFYDPEWGKELNPLEAGADSVEGLKQITDPVEKALADPNVHVAHTPEELVRMSEYIDSTDKNIIDFAEKVRAVGKDGYVKPFELNPVSERQAEDILDITGIDVSGNKTILDKDTIRHIDRRHGLNGVADRSMADDNTLARIQYVLDNYDSITRGEGTKKITLSDGSAAPTVIFEKKIDGNYYIVEAVTDAKSKTNRIVSAYTSTKKVADNVSATKAAYQMANANVKSPSPTANTGFELTAKDNIANSSSNVNAELDPLNAFGLKGEDITSSAETAEDLWRQLEAGDITKNANQQAVQNSYGSRTGLDPLNSQGKLREESYSQNISKGRVENVSPEVQNTFINEPSVYQTLSNAETMQRAQQIYDSGGAKDEIYRMLDVKDPASIPLGNKVMSDLIDEGKSDEAVELLRAMSSKLRESGQFTQAAAITMMKSDPDTALRYAVREIDSLNTAGRKKYGGKWKDFALTDDEIKAFQGIQIGDTDAIKKAYEQIGSRLAKEYPSTKWEKVVELSRVGMLLNPRTQVRNVVSNAMLQPVRSLSDRVSALGQNAIHLFNPDFKVTQSLIGGGRTEKKLAGEVWDSVKDSILEDSSKWDNLKGIGSEKQVFHGSPVSKAFDKIFPGAIERANRAMGKNVDDSLLETVRNFTYYLLERGDEPFVKNNFVSRLSSYMKAQGIKSLDEIPEEAITLAKDEALKATFKDDNSFTRALTGVKQNTGKLGEVVMPFTKTPANLAMRGIDYSPAGLVSTFKSAKNGADVAKIMDDLSKNLVGSAAIFGGYELAKHGIITGKLSSDKDEAAFQKQQGQLAYSIRVGDNYYTYDWAQPAAIPFILGASIYQSVEESDQEESGILKSLRAVGNAAYNGGTSAVNAWAELSPLQSFQDLFSGSYGSEGFAENLANEILEYPQRLIPSWSGALARTMDTTQRQTYSAGNPIQTQIDTAISKIPVLSATLPAAYDTWGNEIRRSDSIGEAAFAQMINPGQLGRDASTWLDSEIQRLYDSTESSTVFPQKSAWTVDGHKLSNREYSDLQREQGSLSYNIVEKLIASDAYDSMEDSARVETIADIYALTKALAENSVVGKEIPKTQQKTAKVYEDQGVEGVINYMMFKATADTDGNGSINQDEARAILDSSDLSRLQKAYYWKLFNSGWKNNPYE